MTTTTALSELAGDYVLDTARSRTGFVARHTLGGRVRGHFASFEGSAHLNGDDPSRSSAELAIRAASIQTHNPQRDEHLRTRFLDADSHPDILFLSTRVTQVDGSRFKVTGDLTVRGVTKPVTVDFELTGAEHDAADGFRVDFKGRVTINRKDWGVKGNASTALLVAAKVTLEFDVAAIRRS
ncbi:YceI family protein [Streptomyces flavofungini]|uniref:YceI family protein n=1 Tax=Streptomyces flavofungini TaxID=68200 RepID=A0ABS0X761_9ACTN|nr:YceI family protein [Streptomyces flavofungini]MBJ3809045.1 YceI family protein [Streptomyces flavofungini]GHC68269.1 polyisoprenoid-binding protein [Streptomyces flavofungini]